MSKRRDFIKTIGVAIGALAVSKAIEAKTTPTSDEMILLDLLVDKAERGEKVDVSAIHETLLRMSPEVRWHYYRRLYFIDSFRPGIDADEEGIMAIAKIRGLKI